MPRLLIIILLSLVFAGGAEAQKRVKLKQADFSRGGTKDGKRFDWVIGNVIFTQNQTTIYCDSAQIFKKENSVEAYGNVKITDGDSVTVTSKHLKYDGDKRVAYLRNDVVFVKLATATLYTDYLDYYRNQTEARYFNGGKLVDSTNTLTSKKGYYNTRTNMASFKTKVVGVNPDYTLKSDTLQYNSKTKIVYFRDRTTVTDRDNQTAVYDDGFYDTKVTEKKSQLNRGTIQTPTYEMKGDKYFLDDRKKFYTAKSHVVMTSKEENLTIFGDDGFYNKKTGVAKVYGHAWMAKVGDDGDTLFLSADTLVSIESNNPSKKRMLAYSNVKIFKSNLQGKADSLAYFSSDSVLYFYESPVLWTTENQMTGDTIRVEMKNQNVDKVYLMSNSFVVSQDSLGNYNQMKGKRMTAFFRNKGIHHVDVDGNGESIYFALQEEEKTFDSLLLRIVYVSGMNKMICSNMKVNFLDGKIDNFSAYVKPDAQFIPPHEIRNEESKLKGFVWRVEERPARADVVPAGATAVAQPAPAKSPKRDQVPQKGNRQRPR
jgi:lipopolysaccharide export system protein LptA